ncbi:MAG: hemerythrin domain-containing protein [Actinobacteria bacterium]|nr:hemerythrin domain-containing protein [Actinomycetota bacterium]
MDAVEYILGKHREMEQLLDQLEQAEDPGRRTELLRDLTVELARHMAVEERVLFPAVRAELCDVDPETFGDDVLENLEEHHVLKTILDELHDMDPDDERFPAKAEVLAETVEHHHEEEEEGVLAGIREHWDDARRAGIGRQLQEAEATAPTRAHPNLPDEGRLVEASQRFAAAIDKARDAVRDAADTLRP